MSKPNNRTSKLIKHRNHTHAHTHAQKQTRNYYKRAQDDMALADAERAVVDCRQLLVRMQLLLHTHACMTPSFIQQMKKRNGNTEKKTTIFCFFFVCLMCTCQQHSSLSPLPLFSSSHPSLLSPSSSKERRSDWRWWWK